MSEHPHSLNLLPVATPGPWVVSHPYSIPLNWGPWHMVGTCATSPPPLYERYKFRIGFNTSIPHWPTRLTQLLCWMCHTHTDTGTHTFWCNPIRTQPIFMPVFMGQVLCERDSFFFKFICKSFHDVCVENRMKHKLDSKLSTFLCGSHLPCWRVTKEESHTAPGSVITSQTWPLIFLSLYCKLLQSKYVRQSIRNGDRSTILCVE